jgi:hypothetical protein
MFQKGIIILGLKQELSVGREGAELSISVRTGGEREVHRWNI